MKTKIDLNCDLGESYGAFKVGNDAGIMPFIASANVACGFHGGDPLTIAKTVQIAKRHNVAVGAHPSFPDLMGFGRREMHLTEEELKSVIIYQVGALQVFTEIAGIALQHVKPHGALYNMAAANPEMAKVVVDAISEVNKRLIVFAPSESALARVASAADLKVANEFFADRAYNDNGSLVSRTLPNSVIQDERQVIQRSINAALKGEVMSVNRTIVKLGKVHTICVHGDNPAAVRIAEILHDDLVGAGLDVEAAGAFI